MGESILAGDVGGTKTAIRLCLAEPGGLRTVHEQTYPSRAHPIEEILERFLAEAGGARPERGCLGVAGAVIEGRVRATNLPWELDEQQLAAATGCRHFKLLNDLEAAAYGMLFLEETDLVVLNPGTRPRGRGNIAVIAAGTGLGEAMLHWDGREHHPIATEGGHADFAARNDREIELLRHLRAELGGRVSVERVLSGPGFYALYRFLRKESGTAEPGWLAERIAAGDPSAAVARAGLDGEDAVCAETLRAFAAVYGAEAGNMALRCMALGGVFVGGGIAPKMLPALRDGAFLEAYADKGRFSALVRSIPVCVSRNVHAPILGCAHYALRL